MWRTVLSFAQKRSHGPTQRATVVGVDLTISTVRAQIIGGGTLSLSAALDVADATDALRDVVARSNRDSLRIDCDLEHGDQRWCVVQLHVVVEAATLEAQINAGTFEAEDVVVGLLKAVWRDARVVDAGHGDDDGPGEEGGDEEGDEERDDAMDTDLLPPCPCWNEAAYPLFAHQVASVRWMQRLEREAPLPVRYAGNLRLTPSWYVDTEHETFTTDPSWREAELTGGICCDALGSGKTATLLRLMLTSDGHGERGGERGGDHVDRASSSSLRSRGTLVLLNINLVSQWRAELDKFADASSLKVVSLLFGKDLRGVTLRDLYDADLVFTTFHFLRSGKAYSAMVDAALGGRPRSRAVLASWARQRGRVEPIVEAVRWKRVVTDEIHQVFESARELRHLRLLTTRVLWGLTATPILDDDRAQHLYLLLAREKAHHPNLLAAVIARAVRGTPPAAALPTPQLQLVQLTEEERLLYLHSSSSRSVEDAIKLTTAVEVSDSEQNDDAATLEEHFRVAREAELATLRAKAAGHQRTVEILERAGTELAAELRALAARCAAGDALAIAQAEATRVSAEANAEEWTQAVQLRDAELAKAERCRASAAYVTERLAALRSQNDTCPICMERVSGVITRQCSHLFCGPCVRRHLQESPWCPTCRQPMTAHDLTGVTLGGGVGGGVGTKMQQIGALLLTKQHASATILFVQWRSMVRGLRAYLRGLGVRIMLLDGNAAQRASTLAEFAKGGTLLLCLEESFAGLHLPHAQTCVFAHAIVGDRAKVDQLERQAIARCLRHGQTGRVDVHSFVVADCAEERVWRRTHG